MKLKSMTSVITKAALVLAVTSGMGFAGTAPSGKYTAPVAPVEEDGALFDTVGASIEIGYDTRYYNRGLYRADNVVWAGLDLGIPLTEQVTFGLGARYLSTVETTEGNGAPFRQGSFDFSELDLSTSLSFDAGFATFGVVYTHREFFDGFSGTNGGALRGAGEFNVSSSDEVGLTVAASVGPVNLSAGWYYDFRIGGSYAQTGADLPIEVTPWLSLVPAVQIGYGFDYYTMPQLGARSGGWTHVIPSISAPIKLTKNAVLTPYIAYNISLNSRHDAAKGLGINGNSQDSEIFGGVSLRVSF